MSLYHEAIQVLNAASQREGSIKSIVFGRKDWKSDVKTLFALATETAKWSAVLSEVIDQSEVLAREKQLTPELALVLTHDLLLARRGLALPSQHGLATSIGRHKARLNAEFSKTRVRRGFATLDAFKAHINNRGSDSNSNDSPSANRHPRWVRINTILTTMDEQLQSTFKSYQQVDGVTTVAHASPGEKVMYVDENIPNLFVIPDHADITSSVAYRTGRLILQDKASCFPAALLDPASQPGDVIDACAAPGNKTTHLASLVSTSSRTGKHPAKKRRIFACERDSQRSSTLAKMVKLADADDIVQCKARQDFLKLDPHAVEFKNVTAILLDPSCSGSGIVGRDEAMLELHLPKVGRPGGQKANGKKRKRGDAENDVQGPTQIVTTDGAEAEEAPETNEDDAKLASRLSALSSFQLRLLQHAMKFPAATRITYSTCSLHDEENEHVVIKALMSDIGSLSGWRILTRGEQVRGLRKWQKRGKVQAILDGLDGGDAGPMAVEHVADACIRCEKGSEDGTMGFFVAGFERDVDVMEALAEIDAHYRSLGLRPEEEDGESEDDEWDGFSESD